MRTGSLVVGAAGGLTLAVLLVAGAATRSSRPVDAVPPAPSEVAKPAAEPIAAAAQPVATPPAPKPASAPSRFAAGMVVELDPESGQLSMPTREARGALTADELQAIARAEAEGLITVRNADGSETLNHEGRFADHTVVRIGLDGKPVFTCAHGVHGVKLALDPSRPAFPAVEEE